MSVGIAEYPESRECTVTDPLESVGVEVTHELGNSDVILCGRRRATLLKHRKPVYYRIRGDLWTERETTRRTKLLDAISWRLFDGVIAPGPHLAKIVEHHTPFDLIPVVPLPVDPTAWPTTSHTGREVRLLTLTNADYMEKVEPLTARMQAIERWCEEHNGEWCIAGDGKHMTKLARAASNYAHVRYIGYVDPETWLDRANVLLHFSEMDTAAPNAILEGMASDLPVVTNDFCAFESVPTLSTATEWELRTMLDKLSDSSYRNERAQIQREYIRKHHLPKVVGEQLRGVLYDGE